MLAVHSSGLTWARENGNKIKKRPYPFFENDLTGIFKLGSKGSLGKQKLVFPQPKKLSKSSLLLANCYWNFKEGENEFRVRMGILLWQKEERKYQFSGFRYESPEGDGDHNFYHAQPITSFEKNDADSEEELIERDNWRHTSLPTFPIKARNSLELFIGMLVSFYGMVGVKKFEENLSNSRTRRELRTYLSDL
jgi:hypothetical protein